MPNLLTEQEFTERFTEAISKYKLDPGCKEPLLLELHYGDDEPVLTLSLKDAYGRYKHEPEILEDVLQPYIQDIGWTVQEPRYRAKEVYELSLPTLRNFFIAPPSSDELSTIDENPKGPIVYDEVLKTATELIVMQFSIYKDDTYTALRKGDTLACVPDQSLLAKLSLHNLAVSAEAVGITATPLQFETLKARSWAIGLQDEKRRDTVTAMTCIPAVMDSLEVTFRARLGLIAIMPTVDQLIVSIDTNDESICELGVLAHQIMRRSPNPMSGLIWTFQEGNLTAVQALELDEMENATKEAPSNN